MDAYINGLGDRDLALRIRDGMPETMQEAHKRALMLESNRLMVDRIDGSRIGRRDERRGDMHARAVVETKKDSWETRYEEEDDLEGDYGMRTAYREEGRDGIDTRMGMARMAITEREPDSRDYPTRIENRERNGTGRPDVATVEPMRNVNARPPTRLTGSTTSISTEASERMETLERQMRDVLAATAARPGRVNRETPTEGGYGTTGPPTCWNCGEEGHTRFACTRRGGGPSGMVRPAGRGEVGAGPPGGRGASRGAPRPPVVCWNCEETGHYSSRCPQPLQEGGVGRGRGRGRGTAAQIALGVRDGADLHNVYLTMGLNGKQRSFLLDSGCDMTLLPLRYVRRLQVKPTDKTVTAANGANIPLAGEVQVLLTLGDLRIKTKALVSEFVNEGMLGHDWMRDNDCYWGFRAGHIIIQSKTFALEGRELPEGRSCRVFAQDDIVVPGRSETVMTGKMIFDQVKNQQMNNGDLVTRPGVMDNGLFVARVVVPRHCTNIPIRVLNVTEKDIVLKKGAVLSDLETVQVVQTSDTRSPAVTVEDDSWKEELMGRVSREVKGETRRELQQILEDYADCFTKSEFDLGRTTLVTHRLDTGNSRPIRQTLRRQPLQVVGEIDRQVGELGGQQVIEPAASPWASNIVVVAKKDGSLRMCVDYRALNNVTRKDSYPLPQISACLDAMKDATFFSTFDLRSGYYQIAMDEEDRDKTAFLTRSGTYRFTAMPFGLTNAPATFQRLMDGVLSGLNREICLVYLDDIILFSKTIDEHLERFRLLLDRLRGANLKLKPSKCHLLEREVHFLGHVIREGTVGTEPEKVEQVVNWPVPRSVGDVRSFLGLVSYYRRCIPQFSQVAAPLHALTGKNARFHWTEECDEAFRILKERLTTHPIVAMPADKGEYVLDTDASNFAIGAVLSQQQDGEERVIAYASRTLNDAERNYCVTRKELLAVVYFTKYFRHYLLGAQFVIRTDHAPLRWLKLTPEPIGQQARWLEKLEEFQFRVEHRPGRHHTNADALSRIPCRQCKRDESTEEPIEPNGPPLVWNAARGFRPEVFQATKQSGSTSARLIQLGGTDDFGDWTSDVYTEAYLKDPDLREIYILVKQGLEQIPWAAMVGQSQATKAYWTQWERLSVLRGRLYRSWKSADGTHEGFQLIPPVAMRIPLVKEAHGGAR